MSKELKKAELYLKESHRFFDFVHEVRRKIDEKIHNMIVLSTVLANITFGLGSLLVEARMIRSLWIAIPLLFSIGLYFIVALIGILVYQPSDVATRNIRRIIDKFEKNQNNTKLLTVVQYLAYNLSCDAERNQEFVIRKTRCFKIMLSMLVVGVASLVVALAFLTSTPTG